MPLKSPRHKNIYTCVSGCGSVVDVFFSCCCPLSVQCHWWVYPEVSIAMRVPQKVQVSKEAIHHNLGSVQQFHFVLFLETQEKERKGCVAMQNNAWFDLLCFWSIHMELFQFFYYLAMDFLISISHCWLPPDTNSFCILYVFTRVKEWYENIVRCEVCNCAGLISWCW